MTSEWQSFFGSLSQVAVTAFTLMFLSMQVRSAEWRGRRLRSVAALAALVELFVPVLIALVSIMNGHPWRTAAALGAALGLCMAVAHVVVYRIDRALKDTTKFDVTQATWGVLVSTCVYVTILVSAVIPTTAGQYLLAGACVWLLFSGSFEAWLLLEPRGLDKPRTKTSGMPSSEPSGDAQPEAETTSAP